MFPGKLGLNIGWSKLQHFDRGPSHLDAQRLKPGMQKCLARAVGRKVGAWHECHSGRRGDDRTSRLRGQLRQESSRGVYDAHDIGFDDVAGNSKIAITGCQPLLAGNTRIVDQHVELRFFVPQPLGEHFDGDRIAHIESDAAHAGVGRGNIVKPVLPPAKNDDPIVAGMKRFGKTRPMPLVAPVIRIVLPLMFIVLLFREAAHLIRAR